MQTLYTGRGKKGAGHTWQTWSDQVTYGSDSGKKKKIKAPADSSTVHVNTPLFWHLFRSLAQLTTNTNFSRFQTQRIAVWVMSMLQTN